MFFTWKRGSGEGTIFSVALAEFGLPFWGGGCTWGGGAMVAGLSTSICTGGGWGEADGGTEGDGGGVGRGVKGEGADGAAP